MFWEFLCNLVSLRKEIKKIQEMKKIYKYISIVLFACCAVVSLQSCGSSKSGCPERMEISSWK
ncbi:MAG: hypothetical protein BGO09_05350 [Bacteroidetes bacterium 47-18]|nr:MAG: hypothetical protein BGO09_05350 [Bacteroidetes bacterium 47-18]